MLLVSFHNRILSDCKIFKHHNTRVVVYNDCENYYDSRVMLTFSRHKQATIDKIFSKYMLMYIHHNYSHNPI